MFLTWTPTIFSFGIFYFATEGPVLLLNGNFWNLAEVWLIHLPAPSVLLLFIPSSDVLSEGGTVCVVTFVGSGFRSNLLLFFCRLDAANAPNGQTIKTVFFKKHMIRSNDAGESDAAQSIIHFHSKVIVNQRFRVYRFFFDPPGLRSITYFKDLASVT